jgi:hypothetical protein
VTALTVFRLQFGLATLFGGAALLTLVRRDWLEAVFGIDPDRTAVRSSGLLWQCWPLARSHSHAWHVDSGVALRSAPSRDHGAGGDYAL